MGKVVRVIGVVFAILIPILVVFGMIRVAWLGYPSGGYSVEVDSSGLITDISVDYGSFLPDGRDFIKMLLTFPSFQEYIYPAIKFWNESNIALGSTDVHDFISFFVAVGDFFRLVGSLFAVLGMVVSYPFAVIGYIFVNLFTPYTPPTP